MTVKHCRTLEYHPDFISIEAQNTCDRTVSPFCLQTLENPLGYDDGDEDMHATRLSSIASLSRLH